MVLLWDLELVIWSLFPCHGHPLDTARATVCPEPALLFHERLCAAQVSKQIPDLLLLQTIEQPLRHEGQSR